MLYPSKNMGFHLLLDRVLEKTPSMLLVSAPQVAAVEVGGIFYGDCHVECVTMTLALLI